MKIPGNEDRRAVFYDASGNRRVLCRGVIVGTLLALLVASFVLCISLGTDPQFPVLPLPQAALMPNPAEAPGIALGKKFPINTPYKLGKDEHYPDPKPFAAKEV